MKSRKFLKRYHALAGMSSCRHQHSIVHDAVSHIFLYGGNHLSNHAHQANEPPECDGPRYPDIMTMSHCSVGVDNSIVIH